MAQALLPAFFLALLAPASAQPYTQVSGVILDSSGSSVPDALLTVVNEETGFRRTILSQPDGGYAVGSLQPGSYKITVRKPGFRTMIRFGVKLADAQPGHADFQLVVGSVQETITVEGSPPLLNIEDASVGIVADREQIEHLPLNGGGLLNLLALAPGVVITPATHGEAGQFSANGQRPNTNYFTVDGVSANTGVSAGGQPAQSTGGALPGLTAFGSLDSLVSLDALQEMREQTSSTVPEFGRLPGAQVSLSSRSGSNEIHGALLYRARNQALDANDWFANRLGATRAALHLNNIAVSLGGPLRRNRTFFFLSYEGMRLLQPFVWRAPVPSLSAREATSAWAQPVLNLFPAPNGVPLGNGLAEWTGNLSRPSRLDSGGARIDQAVTSRITAFARFSESPSSTEFGSSPVNVLDLRPRSLTLALNARATSNLVLDTRFNYSDTTSSSAWKSTEPLQACFLQPVTSFQLGTPGVCDYLVRLQIAGAGQVAIGSEGMRGQSQFQFYQSGAWNHGSHAVRFGGDYRRLEPLRRDATGTLSILADQVSDLTDNANLWIGKSALQAATGRLEEASVFGQDTWRVSSRLTLTYGLRWEISPAPTTGDAKRFYSPQSQGLVSLPRPIWGSTYENLAPRAGLAWRMTRSGRTVLRAGGGLYFDSSLSLATDLLNEGPLNATTFTSARHAPFNTTLSYGFLTDLRLPLVKQWNVSLEQALSGHDAVSVGYAGSQGLDLVRREIGGPGSTDRELLALATNHGSSDYHSLVAQYRRRLANGFQAVASYAWSHSIDNSSSDSGLYWAGSGLTRNRDQASSDFDVRHVVSAGFTYQAPPVRNRVVRGWALDGMLHARSGFPINVLNAEQFTGISFENIFRPDIVPGQPFWIADSSAPRGLRINGAAFQAAPYSVQGGLGRNALQGFGMAQLDLAVRRDFFTHDQRSLQLRVEAFNATNHPNFGDPIRFLSSPLFGQSGSMLNLMLGTGSPGSGLAPVFQSGGARSVQVALRLSF